MPIRQAYLNDMIPSQQRATVLSFDSLMGSSGGVVIQPVLGKTADSYSYATSFVVGAVFQLLAVPFLVRSRREGAPADTAVALSDKTNGPLNGRAALGRVAQFPAHTRAVGAGFPGPALPARAA